MRYGKDSTLYLKCSHSDEVYQRTNHEYSLICSNDPFFYQACSLDNPAGIIEISDGSTACGRFICTLTVPTFYGDMVSNSSSTNLDDLGGRCDDNFDCKNTYLDEIGCKKDEGYVVLPSGKSALNVSICDGKCDMRTCEEEANCNGYQYGFYCYSHEYLSPTLACNAMGNCPSRYHERCHVSEETQLSCLRNLHDSDSEYPLHDNFRCAAILDSKPYCYNYLDQSNCSDPMIIGLFCDIKGYNSSVSRNKVCVGMPLCDDHIDTMCVQSSSICFVHKHRLCDFKNDCIDGSDERNTICKNSSLSEVGCTRRLRTNSGNLPIPLAWLKDGKRDCIDGKDERGDLPSCGRGPTFRYVPPSTSCKNVFLCSSGIAKFIEYTELCDGLESCGNELMICKQSHLSAEINTKVTLTLSNGSSQYLSYCIKGLEDLEKLSHPCQMQSLGIGLDVDIFGRTEVLVSLPTHTRDCSSLFGENYVVHSCNKRCLNSSCPIQLPTNAGQCSTQFKYKVFTIADNRDLTFLRIRPNAYLLDFFICKNSYKCLNFDQVCNLVDDCGDGSDEVFCTNNFQCSQTGHYIPKTSKCDGRMNCHDLSDECNEDCASRILNSSMLAIFSWIIGVMAVVENTWVILNSLLYLKGCKNSIAFVNRYFITMVSFGDLLIGCYLLSTATLDTLIYRDSYCAKQNTWLTSSFCSVIGVTSSMGSQVSIIAMTGLSMIRFKGTYSALHQSGEVTRKLKIKLLIITVAVFFVSALVSILPLFDTFEDYFVNGLTYDPEIKIFIGMATKGTHFSVLQGYYGRMKKTTLSWTRINNMVDNMFSQDFNYKVITKTRKKVSFYGNDPVCLFKYFVKKTDPQRKYVWTVVALDIICFIVVAVCYFAIGLLTAASLRSVNKATMENKRKMKKGEQKSANSGKKTIGRTNRKIAIIISTNFVCIMPFMVLCVLHSMEIFDATPWYSLLSIVILPINSVINPLLYVDTISELLTRLFTALQKRLRKCVSCRTACQTVAQDGEPVNQIEMKSVFASGTMPVAESGTDFISETRLGNETILLNPVFEEKS